MQQRRANRFAVSAYALVMLSPVDSAQTSIPRAPGPGRRHARGFVALARGSGTRLRQPVRSFAAFSGAASSASSNARSDAITRPKG